MEAGGASTGVSLVTPLQKIGVESTLLLLAVTLGGLLSLVPYLHPLDSSEDNMAEA